MKRWYQPGHLGREYWVSSPISLFCLQAPFQGFVRILRYSVLVKDLLSPLNEPTHRHWQTVKQFEKSHHWPIVPINTPKGVENENKKFKKYISKQFYLLFWRSYPLGCRNPLQHPQEACWDCTCPALDHQADFCKRQGIIFWICTLYFLVTWFYYKNKFYDLSPFQIYIYPSF